MRSFRWWPMAALLVLGPGIAVGCQCEPDERPDRRDAAASDAAEAKLREETQDDLGALGEAGALVAVVRPYAWPAMHEVVLAMLAELKLPPQLDLAAAKAPRQLATLILGSLGGSPDPRALQAWDTDRPITASLFETDLDGPVGSLSPTLDIDALPPVRHQIQIPAIDVGALVDGISGSLPASAEPWPQLVAPSTTARGFVVGQTAVAIVGGERSVRVVLVHPVAHDTDVESLRATLWTKPVEWPQSEPAERLLAHDAVAAVMLRPSRLRPIGVLTEARRIRRALTDTASHGGDPSHTAMTRVRGTSAMLAAEVLMGEAGADVDDAAVTLSVHEAGLLVGGTAGLTPQGTRIVAAAQSGSHGPLPWTSGEAWGTATLSADLRALLDASTTPPSLATAERPLSRLGAELGAVVSGYLALRFPFGLAALGAARAKAERWPVPLAELPLAIQLAWVGLSEAELPLGAAVVQWKRGADASPLTRLVSLARTDPKLADVQLAKQQIDEAPVTVITSGRDAASLLDGRPPIPAAALLSVHLRFAPISAAVRGTNAPLSRALAGLGELRGRVSAEADVLRIDATLTPATRPAQLPPRAVAVARPSSPHTETAPEARACLGEAGAAVARGLDALTKVGPASLGAVAAKSLAEAGPALRCAAESSHTHDAATALRRMHAMLAADLMIAHGTVASAAMVLGAGCKAERDAVLCERARSLASLPTPTLPAVALPATCGAPWERRASGPRVSIDAKGIGVLDELVTASTLARRVGALADDASTSPPVVLSIDKATPMSTVRDVLGALASAGLSRVLVNVDDEGDVASIPVALVLGTTPGEEAVIPSAGASWREVSEQLAQRCPSPTLAIAPPH